MSDYNINDLISKMEGRGYAFEHECKDGISFYGEIDSIGNKEHLKFKDWDEVKRFTI